MLGGLDEFGESKIVEIDESLFGEKIQCWALSRSAMGLWNGGKRIE
jgi:hypothetical protein